MSDKPRAARHSVDLGAFGDMVYPPPIPTPTPPPPPEPEPTACAIETFSRVLTGGWGVSEITPYTWTHPNGSSEFTVDGSEGKIVSTATRPALLMGFDAVLPFEHELLLRIDRANTGVLQTLETGLFAPDYDTSLHWVTAQLRTPAGQTTKLDLTSSVGSQFGVEVGAIAGLSVRLRLRVETGQARAKVWVDGDPEPDWQATLTGVLSAIADSNDLEVAGRGGHASNGFGIDTITILEGCA